MPQRAPPALVAGRLALSPIRSGPTLPHDADVATIAFPKSDRPDVPGADDPFGDRALVRRSIRSRVTPHDWIVAEAKAGAEATGVIKAIARTGDGALLDHAYRATPWRPRAAHRRPRPVAPFVLARRVRAS